METCGIELWRQPRVLDAVGFGHSTLWTLVKAGKFPQPVRILEDGRAVGWPSNEVRQWIQARIDTARLKAA